MKKDGDYIRFKPKPNHDLLLGTLAMLTLATSEQLNCALYSPGTLTTTNHLLYQLYQERFLDKVSWRRYDRGNPKTVWKLANRGVRYLKGKGLAPEQLIRPSDNTTHTRFQLTHTIHATDCLVKALEIQKQDLNLRLRYASEPTLRRHPLVVGSGLNEVTIYPDAWVGFTKLRPPALPGEAAIAFELTRTTDMERIKLKWLSWLQADGTQEYTAMVSTDLLVVAWVIDEENITRRDMMARACWGMLKDLHQEDRADLFRFGWINDKTTGEDFYFNPTRFVLPGEPPEPVSLLPMTWREG